MNLRKALNKRRLVVICLLGSAVVSLAGQPLMTPLRRLARLATSPGGDAGMYVTTSVARRLSAAGQGHVSQGRARELATENEILRRRLAQLSGRLSLAHRHMDDIQSIRKRLYGPSREMPSELIPARVVALDAVPYTDSRLLTVRGKAAEKGMLATTRLIWTDRRGALPGNLLAMTPTALVGRLTETDAFSARMQLVTDRNFRIPVFVRRIIRPDRPRRITVDSGKGPGDVLLTAANADVRMQSAARGTGDGYMEIPNVEALHAIEPGDEVFTRDTDPAIGAEVPVGTVAEVVHASKTFVTLRVRPHAALAALREVYIVIPPHSGPAAQPLEGPQ